MTVQLRSYFTALSGVGAVTEAVFDDLVASAGMLVEDKLVAAIAASGIKIAYGTATLTGSATVATGLATVLGCVAIPKTDVSIALCGVSASVGDQAGAPVAGSINLKTFKHTSSGNCTEVAATVAADVVWFAWGT